jgi:trimeric autotransporter adhesin
MGAHFDFKRGLSPRNVLEALLKMPVLTWQYKAQPGNVRHMGPSAQDFRKAFGLGDSPLGISTVDADGVALAAIQGLNQKLVSDSKAKDAKIATLERELALIKKKLGL